MGFGRHFTGVRRVRQTATEMPRQRQHLIFGLWTIAKVINNDGEFAGKRWRARASVPATAKQFDEIEAKLIFPTTAVD
jgi:hypothetical protein